MNVLHGFQVEDEVFKGMDEELVVVADEIDWLSILQGNFIDHLIVDIFVVRIHILVNLNDLCKLHI
jgi:hypothetical protein